MEEVLHPNPGRRNTWIRLLYVVLFAFIYSVAEVVLMALVIIQFGFKLISGNLNQSLLQFSTSLSRFFYEILQFSTFNTDEKPFPFSSWPQPANQDTTRDNITRDQSPD
jgi:hypothetical protein